MSTAVERVMRERGDCTCFHEPFMYDYYLGRAVRTMPHFEPEPDRPRHYEDIRDALTEASERRPVFFKDMSYYVVPRLFDDDHFTARIRSVFLIRDPRRSIPSYYRLDPEVTLEEIGLEAQWRHLEWLHRRQGRAPLVLQAEQVRVSPAKAMALLWREAGLSYMPEALSWKGDLLPDGWGDVAGWHESVSRSDGIGGEADEPDPQQVFDAAAQTAPRLGAYLDHHWPYYERLGDLARRIDQESL